MFKMFGIPNCDTVKKARVALDQRKIEFEFIDFKKTPPTPADLERWKAHMGEWPVNKKGLTFKKHKDAYEKLNDSKLPGFIIANASMIKRPILEKNGKVVAVGFDEEIYQDL